jgi:flavin-dependent dehydrogenase
VASTDFVFNPYGHGWHLDRQAFDALLVEAAMEAGARLLSSTRVMQCVVGDTGGVLSFQSGARQWTVRTKAMLDCSGRSAVVAHHQGVRRIVYDKLVAITTLLTSPAGEDRDSTTMIESSPDGWWYTALLPRQLRIMMYLTDGDLLHMSPARDRDYWQRQLHQTEYMRLIYEHFAYQAVAPPRIVSANSSRLVHTTGTRWVAAGDAAVSFDPLSSQGIITAMTTGQQAAAALLDDLEGDRGARGAYAASLDRLYQEYLTQRTRYYRLERRWPDSIFWQRRSRGSPSLGGRVRR